MNIALNLSINPKASGKHDVTFYLGARSNQTVYPALRFSGFIFFEKHVHSSLYSVTVCEARVTPS
ncbi:MAG: hypothetical protein M5R42_13850 [Rhodocyclaceae bacterium]|nr:hypothetical protein [Rhodocyclaceae bacterium]